MKYLFITIKLRSGEDEFSSKTVVEVDDGQDSFEYGLAYVADFWGNSTDCGDDWVEYPNGIIGKLDRAEVISEEDYNVLKRYI